MRAYRGLTVGSFVGLALWLALGAIVASRSWRLQFG